MDDIRTYSETQNSAPIDWTDRLTQALQTKPDEQTANLYITESLSWVTCACGNTCAALPRNENGMPEDVKLRRLGVTFNEKIERRQWQKALDTLVKIEKRSTKLLMKMGILTELVYSQKELQALLQRLVLPLNYGSWSSSSDGQVRISEREYSNGQLQNMAAELGLVALNVQIKPVI